MRMFGFAARVSLAAFVCLGLIALPANAETTKTTDATWDVNPITIWNSNSSATITLGRVITSIPVGSANGGDVNFAFTQLPNNGQTYSGQLEIECKNTANVYSYKNFGLGGLFSYTNNPYYPGNSGFSTNSSGCGSLGNFTGGIRVGYTTQAQPGTITQRTYYNSVPHPATKLPPDVSAGNCILQDAKIPMLARFAGFPESELITATAVVLAESRGKVNALNLNTNGSYDIGLWQINDGAHPSYDRIKLGVNPAYNAGAAFDIWTAANGWSPWVTYNKNLHANFIPRAQAAVNASAGASIGFTDCSGNTADTKDTNGDGIIDETEGGGVDNNGDENGSDCGFSFNPLDYLKCLFIPSEDAISEWETRIDSIKVKPPISFVTFGIETILNVFSEPETQSTSLNLNNGTTSGGAGIPDNITLPGGTNVDYNPLMGAAEAADSVPFFQYMIQLVIVIGALIAMWPRISKAFGDKV